MCCTQGWQSPLPPCLLFSVRSLCLSSAEGEAVFPLGFIYSFIRLLPVYWKSLIGLQSTLSCSQNCAVALPLFFPWWWGASGAKPPSPPFLQAVERLVVHLWSGNGHGHLSSPQPPPPSTVWGFTRREKVRASSAELCSQLRVKICPKWHDFRPAWKSIPGHLNTSLL